MPLRCHAVPQIGYGSLAKPFLTELQKTPVVREAWLNRTGTLLAVVSAESTPREERAKVVRTVMQNENVSVKELQGAAYERALDDFRSRTGWYQGSEVDQLSREEADIIAKRVARRVKAKVSLSEEKTAKLETALADSLKSRFINGSSKECDQALIKRASAYLDEKALEALKETLKEAVQHGYRAIPSDQETAGTGN